MIETPRLLLRPYQLDDFEAYCEMTSDPAFRFVPAPQTAGEAWNTLLRNLGHWSTFGFGLFAIVDKSSGSFLGETGFLRSRPGSEFDSNNCPVAAWVLKHEAQGRGIALEAALFAHEWLVDVRHIGRTVCMIYPGNTSSLRLADKLGYRAIGERDYKGEVVTMFERCSASATK